MKFIICTLCFFAIPCFTQDHPAVTAQPNSVYVGADGKFESAPDTAAISFNVSVQQETSQGAYQQTAKEVEQVRQVLRDNGIAPQTATVGFFPSILSTNIKPAGKSSSAIA
jgi:uncharacterized protein YggE